MCSSGGKLKLQNTDRSWSSTLLLLLFQEDNEEVDSTKSSLLKVFNVILMTTDTGDASAFRFELGI